MMLIKPSIILFFMGISCLVYSQTGQFNQPWLDTNKAIIIDLYAGNEINWTELKKNNQLVAIIHKASQGLKTDTKYKERKEIALKNGYKWGSYHLGTAGDPIQQADHYLSIVGDYTGELLALDLESDDSTKHMNLANALLFINRIFEKTGKYPMVYCNRNMLLSIHTNYSADCVFSKCPLWYARFRKDIPDFEIKMWNTYTLWQFSSEINCKKTGECLYNIPGTFYDIDVNIYNGSKAELLANWPF